MRLLAADTSTWAGSVALMEGEALLAEWTLQATGTHNRRLLRTIEAILAEAGMPLSSLDAVAVTTGPGSFTGLRIGLATMKALAWARGLAFCGVPTLDALAAPLSGQALPVCALLDARKREVYRGRYLPGGPPGEPRRAGDFDVLPPERAAEEICEATIFCGDGFWAYRRVFEERLGALAVPAPPPFHLIRAGFVAEIARRRIEAGGAEDPVAALPLYVRPSEAEIMHPGFPTERSR